MKPEAVVGNVARKVGQACHAGNLPKWIGDHHPVNPLLAHQHQHIFRVGILRNLDHGGRHDLVDRDRKPGALFLGKPGYQITRGDHADRHPVLHDREEAAPKLVHDGSDLPNRNPARRGNGWTPHELFYSDDFQVLGVQHLCIIH
jgi:hypothetical protein